MERAAHRKYILGVDMKIKLKNPQALPNAWKSCGMTIEEWKDLEAGKTVEVKSLPKLIKDNIDVVGSASKKGQSPKGAK